MTLVTFSVNKEMKLESKFLETFFCSLSDWVVFKNVNNFFCVVLLVYQKAFAENHFNEQTSARAVTGLDYLMGSNWEPPERLRDGSRFFITQRYCSAKPA